MKKYKLIPITEIDPAAKNIAIQWVENFKPVGGMDIMNKHKLASDFMNYAEDHNAKLKAKILKLEKEVARLKELVVFLSSSVADI